jgi:hypothetical protein
LCLPKPVRESAAHIVEKGSDCSSSRLRKNGVSHNPPLLSPAVSDDLKGFGNESVGGYRP